MKRWFVPAAVGLFGVVCWLLIPQRLLLAGDEAGARPRERLFVEAHPGATVRLQLPPGSERIELQAVAAVSLELPYDAADRYYFSFDVGFEGANAPSSRREIALNSRVSIRDDPFSRNALRGARLVVGREDLTDVRLFILEVPAPLRERGGTLVLRAHQGTSRYLLLRAFAHRDMSPGLEQYASLSPSTIERRGVLSAAGTALSEYDVAPALWDDALSRPVLRMAPVGSRGQDYITRRVLLSNYRRPFQDTAVDRVAALECGPRRWLALNLRGDVALRFSGEPNTTVAIRELFHEASGTQEASFGPVTSTKLDSEGRSPLVSAKGPVKEPRTVVVSCPKERTTLQVHTDRLGLQARLGEIRPGSEAEVLPEGPLGYPLRPDIRRVRFLGTNDGDVADYVVPRTGRIRIEMRRLALQGRDVAALVAEVTITAAGEPTTHQAVRVDMPVSRFERTVAGVRLSEPHYLELPVPAGASVRVLGAEGMLHRVSVLQPDVHEVYALDYRGDVGGKRWRYAPRDLDGWAPLDAQQHEYWVANNGFVTVAEQVRLVDRTLALARDPQKAPRSGSAVAASVGEASPRPATLESDAATVMAAVPVQGDERDAGVNLRTSDGQGPTLDDPGDDGGARLTGNTPGPAAGDTQPATGPARQPRTSLTRPRGDRFRPGPRFTRSLTPHNSPRSHRVFVKRPLPAGRAPRSALTELRGQREVWIIPGAPAHRLLLRPDPASLGQPVSVWVEGVLQRTLRVRTTASYIPFPLSPGVYRLEVRGLGARGVAYATGLPASGEITRQRRYHRLAGDSPLQYRFPVVAEERQLLLLQVLSDEETPRCFRARVTVERLDPELPREVVMERQACTHHAEEVLFWDLGARTATLATQLRLPLARVRNASTREVWVELLPVDGTLPETSRQAEELYLRALLIGDAMPPESETVRFRRHRE